MRWKETEYSGWGGVLRAKGRLARPEKISQLKDLGPLPAIGGRLSYGDTSLVSDGDAIDMTRMDRFLSFDETSGILDVEAGATIGEILRVFGPKGWKPAIVPGTGFATVGGSIANDIHGKNHHVLGSFGQHVESINLIGADGKARRISAKREANVFQATIGGLGQTGIIASARIRLKPCPGGEMEVSETRIEDIDDFIDAFERSVSPYSVGWVDTTAKGDKAGRGILEEGDFVEGSDFANAGKTSTVPFNLPSFAMNQLVVKAFNAVYIRRVPEDGRTRIRAIEDFFFPLDRIHKWNRLYGKKGFYQFQCVVPMDGAAAVIGGMLNKIARSGLASPLAVLKMMGDGKAGMMSFPMAGITLSVDFPNRKQSAFLIKELEEMTLQAKGKIYLAKDALSSPETIRAMYPELEEYSEIINRVDPEGIFATDLVKRLELRGQS